MAVHFRLHYYKGFINSGHTHRLVLYKCWSIERIRSSFRLTQRYWEKQLSRDEHKNKDTFLLGFGIGYPTNPNTRWTKVWKVGSQDTNQHGAIIQIYSHKDEAIIWTRWGRLRLMVFEDGMFDISRGESEYEWYHLIHCLCVGRRRTRIFGLGTYMRRDWIPRFGTLRLQFQVFFYIP